jgi:hypothetical protein
MNPEAGQETYQVWAADKLIYGPIDLPTLRQWVAEGRVLPNTWVYTASDGAWHEAGRLADLEEMFQSPPDAAQESSAAPTKTVAPEELRQFAIFSGLSDEQLGEFLQFGDLCELGPQEVILRKGDPGDALFFVLDGSVRARLLIGGEDRSLGQIPAGQFFGEMAMFNRAPRSADIVSEDNARLFRLTSESFLGMVRHQPGLAAPILFSLASTMAARISEANSRFQREVAGGFLWS